MRKPNCDFNGFNGGIFLLLIYLAVNNNLYRISNYDSVASHYMKYRITQSFC